MTNAINKNTNMHKMHILVVYNSPKLTKTIVTIAYSDFFIANLIRELTPIISRLLTL